MQIRTLDDEIPLVRKLLREHGVPMAVTRLRDELLIRFQNRYTLLRKLPKD